MIWATLTEPTEQDALDTYEMLCKDFHPSRVEKPVEMVSEFDGSTWDVTYWETGEDRVSADEAWRQFESLKNNS